MKVAWQISTYIGLTDHAWIEMHTKKKGDEREAERETYLARKNSELFFGRLLA
jgi:hypothetical protein